MKPLLSVSAVVLVLALAGTAIIFAAHDDPRRPIQLAPVTPASAPENDFGKEVKLGQAIFNGTNPLATPFVGNSLRCASCHLDAGRLAHSAPLWSAYLTYPANRSKNKHVNTLAERMQGCFSYSMNGKAPPLGHPVLVALASYAFFLAQGAPVGAKLPGGGYPTPPQPALAMDP